MSNQRAGKPAAARKAAAARAEQKASTDSKTFQWRGNVLALPDRLPATVAFDLAELQDGNGESLGPMFRFLSGLIGADQVTVVRNQVAKDGDPLDELDEILAELLDGVLSAFGMSLGESEASPSS